MSFSLWRAARGKIGDERRADVGTPAAAILQKEQRDFAEAGEVGTVDDGAAVTLAAHQTGARENAQVRRHGVLRNGHEARQFAYWDALGLASNQKPERIQARGLGERGKGRNCFYIIHISRLMDIYDGRKKKALVQKSKVLNENQVFDL